VALETVGCRLNQYETEKMAGELAELGLRRVSYNEKADLYILNTCTVTGRADADCRKLIHRARRLNEHAIIVVAGCYVVSKPEEIAGLDGVDLAVGNDQKMHLAELLLERYPELFNRMHVSADETASPAASPNGQEGGGYLQGANRALVKIGDGCNQDCSYCIVPKVRGRQVWFAPEAILDEVRRLVDDGYHEVVLTAVHVGKYAHDGIDLARLIERILSDTFLSRLRLSSVESNELDERLIDYVAHHPRVCRHLHLPLQSGSNRILKMMRRPYTREKYLNLVATVKGANADITIGCDLIVGFPGETDDDFAQSLDALRAGGIDYGHIFSYSDRPGTAASAFPDKVGAAIIKERNRQAREICRNHRIRQMERQIGKVLGVISEHTPNRHGGYNGISDNYLKVHLPPSSGGKRDVIHFKPALVVGDHLEGEVVP